ncbi:Uncharacterized protein Fot_33212 [Forsythia ovata]|uniref:Uncharacterized protein n=1 Tax=Forsythia ovata TaxID=205694 RepID=A0ABD1T9Z5_9LAMI
MPLPHDGTYISRPSEKIINAPLNSPGSLNLYRALPRHAFDTLMAENHSDLQEILTYFRGSELQNYFTRILEDNLKTPNRKIIRSKTAAPGEETILESNTSSHRRITK